MADHILVSTQLLEQAAHELDALKTVIDDVCDRLASVDTSKGSGGDLKVSVGGLSGSTAAEVTRSLRKAMRNGGEDIRDIASAVRKSVQIFEEAEEQNRQLASGSGTGGQAGVYENSNGTGSVSGGVLGAALGFDLFGSQSTKGSNEPQSRLDKNSKVFDDEGGYGGDQGDLKYKRSGHKFSRRSPFHVLPWRVGKDQQYFDFVRTREGYQDYTDEQIARLFYDINEEGCEYVSVVNAIFSEFEGREEEFEHKFGFPMYDEDGELNYNRLLIDFYTATDDKYYLNEADGANALAIDILRQYRDKPDAFKAEYGIDLMADEYHLNTEAMDMVLERYESQEIVDFEHMGANQKSVSNRMLYYLKSKGIQADCGHIYLNDKMTTTDVQAMINEGKVVSIETGHFILHDESGQLTREYRGGHAMTITGTTEDGRYIVSSWGERFYLNPNELDEIPSYFWVDIK